MMSVAEILEALKAIIDAAEGRSLTDDEVERYETLETQLKTAQKDEEIRTRQAAYETPIRNDLHVHIATPKEDKTLERAFSDWARTGQENADVVQLRAQGEGTGPAGGYLVPATMVNRLTERMKAFGGLEGVADVMTTTSGEVLNWPSLDDTSNEGEVVAEGAAPAGGADLVFGKRELGAYRFTSTGTGANPIRVSSELLMDNKFDVEGRIMNKLGERIARHAAPLFVRGNGVGQPEGIVNGCTSANGRAIELENDTNGLTYDDLINFEHSVDPAYRNMGNCSWAFNDASLKVIKKLQDSNGDPLWLPVTNDRLAANIFNGLLLGYPVLIDQGFVDLDVDDITDMWGVFGDIKEGLVIRKVSSIVVIRDPFTRKNEWEVEFVAHQRMDSIQNDKNAYVALTGEA